MLFFNRRLKVIAISVNATIFEVLLFWSFKTPRTVRALRGESGHARSEWTARSVLRMRPFDHFSFNFLINLYKCVYMALIGYFGLCWILGAYIKAPLPSLGSIKNKKLFSFASKALYFKFLFIPIFSIFFKVFIKYILA